MFADSDSEAPEGEPLAIYLKVLLCRTRHCFADGNVYFFVSESEEEVEELDERVNSPEVQQEEVSTYYEPSPW